MTDNAVLGIVLNTSTHPIDLHDGRVLGPNEWAEGVSVTEPHNVVLIDSGKVRVVKEVPKDSPRSTVASEASGPESSSAVAAPRPTSSGAPAPEAAGG